MNSFRSLLGRSYLLGCTLLTVLVLVGLLGHIAYGGWEVLGWDFLTSPPRRGMAEGGIFPAIAGTVLLSLLTVAFSLPLGLGTALYLSEYMGSRRAATVIQSAIRNLAGVPSMVYGLFGVVLFVDLLGLGTSILSAGLTLGLLTLPWIIVSSEEALRAVPGAYREGALALGATRWQVVRSVVLPAALPGVASGAVTGLGRAAGETAPILFTGVAFYLPFAPQSLSDQFMALPYHLYVLSTQHHAVEKVRPLAYATALVLVALVVSLNLCAAAVRSRARGRAESGF